MLSSCLPVIRKMLSKICCCRTCLRYLFIPQLPELMNISRKNSFAPKRSLGFTVAPYRPVNRNAAPVIRAAAGSDMIELSYSHGKPSTFADVMTPIRREFKLAQQLGGGRHTVIVSGRVDDSVSVKVDGSRKTSSSGSAHNFSLTFENLSPGLHCLHVKHNNINSYLEPTGNISLICGTVGPCLLVEIIPGENMWATANAPAPRMTTGEGKSTLRLSPARPQCAWGCRCAGLPLPPAAHLQLAAGESSRPSHNTCAGRPLLARSGAGRH